MLATWTKVTAAVHLAEMAELQQNGAVSDEDLDFLEPPQDPQKRRHIRRQYRQIQEQINGNLTVYCIIAQLRFTIDAWQVQPAVAPGI